MHSQFVGHRTVNHMVREAMWEVHGMGQKQVYYATFLAAFDAMLNAEEIERERVSLENQETDRQRDIDR